MTRTPLACAASAAMLLVCATGAQARETKVTWKGAPEFSNGDWTFKPRGRVFLDFVHQEVDGGSSVAGLTAGNSRIRTARLGVEGSWTDRFRYVAEASIANGEAAWEDLYLAVEPVENVTVKVGNFKTVSLENITSHRYTTFMERGPLNDVLGVGRTLNVALGAGGRNWTVGAALSGDNVNELDAPGDQMAGASLRATFAPVVTDTARVHLGGWARHRERGDDETLRYRARPNTNYGARYIDTGAIGRSDTTTGLEAAAVLGAFSVQGEYGRLNAERASGEEAGLDTFYVFASWFPTGESRNYEPARGAFGRTKIKRPVDKGGPGAVELALRYDHADLGDAFIPAVASSARAGEYDGVTVGVNWYPITYVRFMANYTRGENDSPGESFDAQTDTFQLRAQFDF